MKAKKILDKILVTFCNDNCSAYAKKSSFKKLSVVQYERCYNRTLLRNCFVLELNLVCRS